MDDYILENPKQQNILIALVCAGAFIANLDMTIVNITLPVLSREFSVSPGLVSWTTLAYLLFEAGFMLPMGRLADVKGIKTVYLSGLVVFLIGSLACGFCAGIGQLIAFRAFQGMGGAMLFTVMLSFIPIYIPQDRHVMATGLATTAAAAGVGLGPPLGGLLSSFFGWRWIFFVNVPFCAAAIIAGMKHIPSRSPQPSDRRLDTAGAVLSFLAFVLFLYGVNMGREQGWTSPLILSCLALSIALMAAFVVREFAVTYPLVDFGLFRNRTVLFGLLSLGEGFLTVGGVLFIFPFYLIEYRGLDVTAAGAILFLVCLGQFAGPLTGALSKKIGVLPTCITGLGAGILSFLLFFALDCKSSVPFIAIALGLFGLSQGLSKAPGVSLIMDLAPPEKKNSVASLATLCRSLSVALGVLFFETIFSDSIPHAISLENTHISAVIENPAKLAAGFHNVFLFGGAASLLALIFMALAARKQRE